MHSDPISRGKQAAKRLVPLLLAVAGIALSIADRAAAAPRGANSPAAANALRAGSGSQSGRAVVSPPARAVIAPPVRAPAAAAPHRETKDARPQTAANRPRANAIARNGLPRRPLPGEAGFTGVPPRGETRFISNEMVFHVGANVPRETVAAAAQRLGLTPLGSQSLAVTGGTLFRFRLGEGRQVADVVRALETQKIGTAQPNYTYKLQQDARATAPLPLGDSAQYAVRKLRLGEAHRLANGKDVLVALIDSQIDTAHPDLAGAIGDQFEAAAAPDKPDDHGTGMTGAIVAHRKLLGVAPGARILAVHAFSPEKQSSPQATTQHILAGIDWAIAKGARIINMSFAGPYDPMLQLALKKAHDKGIVLIAAAGNAGPRSQPLYPAADENVIAVTAIDARDKLLPQANQGPHIALAAPGVDIVEPAANAEYQVVTGTSVAAAHVSGVAALIIERKPDIDFAALEKLLFSTTNDLGRKGRDSQFGFGLVDPYRALSALEPKVAADHPAPPVAAPAQTKPLAADTKPLAAATPPATFAVSQLAPGAAPTAAPRSADADDTRASVEKKRFACRQEGMNKGMRGPDLQDYVVVCLAEARLACLKQAVAQKVHGAERRDFLNSCLGS
jgi:subtilisin family serine protease